MCPHEGSYAYSDVYKLLTDDLGIRSMHHSHFQKSQTLSSVDACGVLSTQYFICTNLISANCLFVYCLLHLCIRKFFVK